MRAKELVGRRGAAAPGGIIGKIRRWIVRPGVEDRLHRLPTGFHGVGALKQRRVANHAVIEQRFVAGIGRDFEIVLVGEIHADVAEPHDRARALGGEFQCDSLIRLESWIIESGSSAPPPCHETVRMGLDESGSQFRSSGGADVARGGKKRQSGPRQLSMSGFHATKVSVVEFGVTYGSSRYGDTFFSTTVPPPYWPRTASPSACA